MAIKTPNNTAVAILRAFEAPSLAPVWTRRWKRAAHKQGQRARARDIKSCKGARAFISMHQMLNPIQWSLELLGALQSGREFLETGHHQPAIMWTGSRMGVARSCVERPSGTRASATDEEGQRGGNEELSEHRTVLEGKGVAIADEVRELASSGAVFVAFDLLQRSPNHTAAPALMPLIGDGSVEDAR